MVKYWVLMGYHAAQGNTSFARTEIGGGLVGTNYCVSSTWSGDLAGCESTKVNIKNCSVWNGNNCTNYEAFSNPNGAFRYFATRDHWLNGNMYSNYSKLIVFGRECQDSDTDIVV